MKPTIFIAIVVTIFLSTTLVGCEPSVPASNRPASEQGQGKSALSIQPNATSEQWLSAVMQTFDKVNVDRLRDKKTPAYVIDEGKTDEDGVINFFACFDKAPPKCELSASGKRDGFRKIQFFMNPRMEFGDLSAKYARGGGKPSLRAYISLTDCSRPAIILLPTFRGENWIFLEQFGLMLDGTLVIERKFGPGQVDRDNSHNELSESVHIALKGQEIDALRKLAQAKQVLVRLTGRKGYVGIDQDGTINFVQGVTRLVRIYDALDQAVGKLGQVKDAGCPL